MIKYLLIILFTTSFLSPINYQERFLQANEHYKTEEFEKACKLYDSIPNKSGIIHYNLGNCYYKLGYMGKALACWRRAEREWSFWNKEDLIYNISLIEQRAGFEGDIKNKLYYFIISIPMFILQIVFLLFWFLLFLYLRYLYKKKHKALIIFLYLVIVSLAVLLLIKYSLENKRMGVITSKQASIFSGPGKQFSVLDKLPEIAEVIITKESGNYYKINFDDKVGWINRESIEEI